MNRNTDTVKIIPACKGRQSTGSKQSLEKSQQWLISFEELVPTLHLQCSDLYFLSWDNVFLQWVIMWVCLWPPTHRSSASCEKQCPVGLSCLTADFSVQWAAMIACIFESKIWNTVWVSFPWLIFKIILKKTKAQLPKPSKQLVYVHIKTIIFMMLLGQALSLWALGIRILIYLKLKV